MRIKQVRVYQAVQFENTSHVYFTANEFLQPTSPSKLRDISIELMANGYVRIVNDKCVVDIGPGNIAYIEYAREDYEAPPKKLLKPAKGA